jgi:hypothetical protein
LRKIDTIFRSERWPQRGRPKTLTFPQHRINFPAACGRSGNWIFERSRFVLDAKPLGVLGIGRVAASTVTSFKDYKNLV